jgi:predicted ferric reductase
LGVPFAIVFISPGYVMLLIQQIMRIYSNYFNPFQIIDISVSFDCSYIMIYLLKPKNYKLIHGQYVFMNVPAIHPLQWHPFTVASSPTSPYLTLMIKKAGDWTGKLIRRLQQDKMRMMKMDEFESEKYTKYDTFNLLHDLHQEIPLKDVIPRNKLFYPSVKISKACSTPNDTFMEKDNVILIGAGSGISPYLPLLEEVIREDKGKSNKFKFKSARLIFIAREGEQVSWISNYLFHIIESD